MQKPGSLTTFSRSDDLNNLNLRINFLTPTLDSQLLPAKSGQKYGLLQKEEGSREPESRSILEGPLTRKSASVRVLLRHRLCYHITSPFLS